MNVRPGPEPLRLRTFVRERLQFRAQPRAVVLVLLIAVGIGVVETGLRSVPAQAGTASIAEPRSIAPLIGAVRDAPKSAVTDARSLALVEGIVFGRSENIGPIDQEHLKRSGLWHLVAASGQNIALVIGLSLASARLVGGGRLLGTIWGLIAVPVYVLIVGGGPSIVRAGIMGELALLAWLSGQLHHAWDALLVSAVLLVWIAPGSHRSLGAQLSFACVIALLLGATRSARWLRRRCRLPGPLAAGIAATLVCSIASAPILLWRTGSAPLAGAIVNLAAVPLASLILVVGLVGACVHLVWPAPALPLLQACGLLAKLLLALAAAGAQLPFAAVELAPRRASAPAAAVADTVASGALRISFLDVGQGDAILLQVQGRAVLVDTGPEQARVAASLRSYGVRKLDGLVITHAQDDHAGGAAAIVAQAAPIWVAGPPDAVALLDDLSSGPTERRVLCRGQALQLDTVVVEVIHPRCESRVSATGDAANDNAVVLLITHGGVRLALTADAEATVTGRLALPRLTLLKVAHHGSADPRLGALLERTRPQIAVISVGSDNAYGHPADETIEALADAGTPVARTDRHGTLVFDSDGTALRLSGASKLNR